MSNKFNFTDHIDRRGKDAAAVDRIGGERVWGAEPEGAREGFSEIPMWVADMNFATCPSVTKALQERIAHPLYGYFSPDARYYERIIAWQKKYHGYEDLTREEIGYQNGVHGGICSVISLFTQPGEHIFMHSPTYCGFLGDLKEWGRVPTLSLLKKDEQGVWRMDFEDMERRIVEDHVHLAVFCSPHNPSGRVWERWEIEKAMEIFRKYDVLVISDEIWSDILLGGRTHIPTCLVSEDARMRTISFYAPSKTFNLAGLIGSYHIIYNPKLREALSTFGAHTHYNEMNVLSMHALIGAYTEEGSEWVSELCEVIEQNCRYGVTMINEQFDGCEAAMPEGTYMLFMDVRQYCEKHGKTLDDILKAGWDVGVAWQDGRMFAADWSIRINCALPEDILKEAFHRMKKYVFV